MKYLNATDMQTSWIFKLSVSAYVSMEKK